MRAHRDERVVQGRVTGGHQFGEPAGGSRHEGHRGHGGHGWMMIACCVPMLVIAVVLVATRLASPAFLLVAVGCTLMMAMMMGGMSHGAAMTGADRPGHRARAQVA